MFEALSASAVVVWAAAGWSPRVPWTWPNDSPSWRASAHSASHPQGRLVERNQRIETPTRPYFASKCNNITFAAVKRERPDKLLTLQRFGRPALSARAGWRRNLNPVVLKPWETRENRGGTADYEQ